MSLDNYIDFKKLITIYDESEMIKESIISTSNNEIESYIDEKIPKKYFNPFFDFIIQSSSLQYKKIKDNYFEPCIDDYENICNEIRMDNKKEYSSAPLLCSFLDEYDSNPSEDMASETSSDDENPIQPVLTKNVFFKSTDKSTILFYIDFQINDNDTQMFGLVNLEEATHIYCGAMGSHPFVITNDFTYDYSHGSVSDISDKLLSAKTADQIFYNVF